MWPYLNLRTPLRSPLPCTVALTIVSLISSPLSVSLVRSSSPAREGGRERARTMWHAAAAPNNLHPAVATTSSPALRRARWPIARPSSSVKVQSSTRNGNGSADNLDHLQRASKGRQQRQGASAPGTRARRVVRTTPFGEYLDFWGRDDNDTLLR
jgi:hypothetical protein